MTNISHSRRNPLVLAIGLCFASAAPAVTITVTSGDDSSSLSACTLRNAITAINYGNAVLYYGCQSSMKGPFGDNDTVVFDASLANSTITLTQGQIANFAPLTVLGSGQTLDVGGRSRVVYTIAFLQLYDLTLTGGNSGPEPGGAVYSDQAYVLLAGVHIRSNRSSAAGGGMAVANGSAKLIDTVISGNTAGGGHGGGGLSVSAGSVILNGSTLSDNSAQCGSHCGGGMAVINGTATISASTLARNTAGGSSGIAGGIYAGDSKITLVNSTLADNVAAGTSFIAGALLENQTAAVASEGASLTNTTISGNSATGTGGAGIASGGILIGAGGTGRLALANTIISANRSSGGATTVDLAVAAGSATASSSLLGSALGPTYAGNGNVFSDIPGLMPLADNGGTTETFALRGDSPAVDAGSNALAMDASAHPLGTDQRGWVRDVGSRVDIGAVEFPGDAIFRDGFGF